MKSKIFLPALALLICLLGALMLCTWIGSKNADYENEKRKLYANAAKVPVIAVCRPMRSGMTIQASDLGVRSVYSSYVTSDNILPAFVTNIIGRTLIHDLDTKNLVLWSYIDGQKKEEKDNSRMLGK